MEGVIGYTTMFAGNFEPKNWAFCQGQIIPIASNTALFSILGTVYGGNGTTTFALPDLRGRSVIGAGAGPGLSMYDLGQIGGASTATLNVTQMPAHAHPVSVVAAPYCLDDSGNVASPSGAAYASSTGYAGAGTVNMAACPAQLQMSPMGGTQPFSIEQPYMAMNYIICMRGVFPARN